MYDDSILIVEDDDTLGQTLESALAMAGYSVRVAGSCSVGLGMALDQIPKLLILDITLPDGTGWNLLESIRRTRPSQQIRVLMISSERVTRSQLRENGADRFLAKPFDMVRFMETVKELTRLRQGVACQHQLVRL